MIDFHFVKFFSDNLRIYNYITQPNFKNKELLFVMDFKLCKRCF